MSEKLASEKNEFEIQVCGADLVVVFEQEMKILADSQNGNDAPVFTGKKTCVFDEHDLVERIALLKKLKAPSSAEMRALGELRRAVFAVGLPPKRSKAASQTESAFTQDKSSWITDLLKTMNQRG
jgi:hypothetical protein